MGQTWTDNCFQSDHQGQADFQDMEYNFACLKSMFQGAGQPSIRFRACPGSIQRTNCRKCGIMQTAHGSVSWRQTQARKYGFTGMRPLTDWLIDATVTDCVIALKGGGATNPYNVSGGQTAGTWQQPGHVLIGGVAFRGYVSAQHIASA